jgi:hypothetical protein
MNVADGASNLLHPWAGSLVSISIVNGRNTGHKKLLLRAGIVRKLTLDESKLEQPTLYVTPHHWPISLHCLAPLSRTTLLSLNLAKTIQDTDGHSHLTDPLYQALSLAKKYKFPCQAMAISTSSYRHLFLSMLKLKVFMRAILITEVKDLLADVAHQHHTGSSTTVRNCNVA